jgi:hypothetical protein
LVLYSAAYLVCRDFFIADTEDRLRRAGAPPPPSRSLLRRALFDDEGTVASVYKFLNEYDISTMPAIRPETEYFKALKRDDADSVIEWVKVAVLEDVKAADAFVLYKQWAADTQVPYPKTICSWGKTMSALTEQRKVIRRLLDGCYHYSK